MEDLSIAYLTAISAINGYSVVKEGRDNDGVDIKIKCKGKPDPNCKFRSATIDVQLKASYGSVTIDGDGNIRFVLPIGNYRSLIETDRATPIILVLLHMHKDPLLWLEHSGDYLKLTKCAYWLSLKGMPASDNATSITIFIPKENVLSPAKLKELMITVANDQDL